MYRAVEIEHDPLEEMLTIILKFQVKLHSFFLSESPLLLKGLLILIGTGLVAPEIQQFHENNASNILLKGILSFIQGNSLETMHETVKIGFMSLKHISSGKRVFLMVGLDGSRSGQFPQILIVTGHSAEESADLVDDQFDKDRLDHQLPIPKGVPQLLSGTQVMPADQVDHPGTKGEDVVLLVSQHAVMIQFGPKLLLSVAFMDVWEQFNHHLHHHPQLLDLGDAQTAFTFHWHQVLLVISGHERLQEVLDHTLKIVIVLRQMVGKPDDSVADEVLTVRH